MIRWPRLLLWLLLAIPAALMITDLAGGALAMDLYHPSGEMAVRLMILALLPGPLVDAFGPNRFLRGWIAVRRNLGVAAFLYGLLHLFFYVLDMQMVSAMIGELAIPGIWTGWAALIAMAAPAALSFDAAMRRLGSRWKRWQRLVYPAFLVALVHWLLLDWAWLPAFIHLAPVMLAWALRFTMRRRKIQRSVA